MLQLISCLSLVDKPYLIYMEFLQHKTPAPAPQTSARAHVPSEDENTPVVSEMGWALTDFPYTNALNFGKPFVTS